MTLLAPHLTAFLRERLPQERQASRHTVDTYTYMFKLLFAFTTKRLGVAPSALTIEQLDAPLLLEFLAHLQAERGNSARTRNSRLVAIKSFMRFVEYRVPSAIEQVRRVNLVIAEHLQRRGRDRLLFETFSGNRRPPAVATVFPRVIIGIGRKRRRQRQLRSRLRRATGGAGVQSQRPSQFLIDPTRLGKDAGDPLLQVNLLLLMQGRIFQPIGVGRRHLTGGAVNGEPFGACVTVNGRQRCL